MKLERTREWRESRGLTQRELAAAASVGEPTVPRIERGAGVTPPTARKIAAALDVTVADLMSNPPQPSRSVQPAGKAEAPTGAGQAVEADDVGVLLRRLGSPTMHLAEGALSKKLEEAPLEAALKASREARNEAHLLAPEIRRLLAGAKEGSPEFVRAMRVWGDAAARLLALRWLIRARRGAKLYEIPLGVPDQDWDQGRKQDPRQDRLAGEVTVELEALRDLELELEVVLG